VTDLKCLKSVNTFYSDNSEQRSHRVKKTKLESYVDVLIVLAEKGPLKVTDVKHQVYLNCTTVKKNLRFLINLGLVEVKLGKRDSDYFITQRGEQVLRYFRKTAG
jgi:predicted transcriptional regulator